MELFLFVLHFSRVFYANVSFSPQIAFGINVGKKNYRVHSIEIDSIVSFVHYHFIHVNVSFFSVLFMIVVQL